MENSSVKTIWYTQLEAARRRNAVYVPDTHSTINEKFGIQENVALATGELPDVSYLAIGRGGHKNVMVGGASLTDTLTHRINNACLFEHIPFVMRETGNDLSGTERAKYRMRRLETHNGTDYFVYYMKVLSIDSLGTSIMEIDTTSGTPVSTTYTPTAAQLTPQPVSNLEYTGKHLGVSNILSVVLDNTEIQDIIDACAIIYNDNRFAAISELAICSGFDKSVSVTDGGVSVTYTEAIASQVCTFLPGEHKSLIYQSQEVDYKLNVGNTLPWRT